MSDEELEVKEPKEEPKEDFEEKAKQIGGYMTKEEWEAKGRDPKDWRDPETFVKIGEKINSNYKERFEKEEAERLKLKEELAAHINVTNEQLGKVRKDALEKAKAEYEDKLALIKEERKEAFETLDYEKLEQAEAKIEKLKPPEEEEPKQPVYKEPPQDFITWEKENPWWNENDDMKAYAVGISGKVQTDLKIPDGIELYNAVTERVKSVFPDYFKNPKREEAPNVEGETPDEEPPTNGKKTWKDLPKSAKEAYKKQAANFEMQGFDFPKEQYVESYFKQFSKEM